MKGTVLYGPRDVRFEELPTPKINKPTDAVIRIAATCVCGSDLWPYRGLQPIDGPIPMGHEYCGVVEEVGKEVRNIKPGQFVIGSFATSDNTCPHCLYGYQSSCVQREFMLRAQAPFLRVPQADGTLVPTPGGAPSEELVPSLLACSDVLGTGWFAADAANVRKGSTVVVVVGAGSDVLVVSSVLVLVDSAVVVLVVDGTGSVDVVGGASVVLVEGTGSLDVVVGSSPVVLVVDVVVVVGGASWPARIS